MSLRVRIARVVVLAGLLGFVPAGLPAIADAESCPNEQLRAEQGDQHLPDCRAYEQVTPSDKGATTPLWEMQEAVGVDGNQVWLKGSSDIGPDPTLNGVNAVMSRSSSGWTLASMQPPGAGDLIYEPDIFNPNLTMVGAETKAVKHIIFNSLERSFVVGEPGGPYTTIATTVDKEQAEGLAGNGHFDFLAGASEDFSHVVLASEDHTLAPGAAATVSEAHDLYEWSRATGKLQLANVTTGGSLVNPCGAVLGEETTFPLSPGFRNPMSSDGSKIFFIAPQPDMGGSSEPGCKEAQHLYMRVDGKETVDISEPQPGVVDPTGYHAVHFVGATPDGVHVWFVTTTELTPDDTGHLLEIYEYNTVTRKLLLVSEPSEGGAIYQAKYEENAEDHFVFSEDGSTLYFETYESGGSIYRYDTATKTTHYVASVAPGGSGRIQLASSADGAALVFWGRGAVGAGGFSHGGPGDQVYVYTAATEHIICVSCAPEGMPTTGSSFLPYAFLTHSNFLNGLETAHPVSDGGRYVFFSSNKALVPEDGTVAESEEPGAATDVYEWESQGTGSCTKAEGCVSLISTPNSGLGSYFIGASADGRDLFFLTSSALVPQDKDSVADVYDARIDGGFPVPHSVPCSGEGCRLIASSAPVFGTPQSVAFVGAGNPPVSPVAKKVTVSKNKVKKKAKKKKKTKRKARRGRKASRSLVGASNGRGR